MTVKSTWSFRTDKRCIIVIKYGVSKPKNVILTSIIIHDINYNKNAKNIVRLTVTALVQPLTLTVAYVLRGQGMRRLNG